MSTPGIQFRQALLARTPITLADAQGSPVEKIGQAAKIYLGPDVVIDKVGAFASVPLDAHPSTINLPILYVVWSTHDKPVADYLREARANGVAFVPTEKRKPVIDWLKGEGPDSPVAVGNNLASTTSLTGAGSSGAQTQGKRKYVPDRNDIEAVAKIHASEFSWIDRSAPLRSTTLTSSSSKDVPSSSSLAAKKDFTYIYKTIFADKIKPLAAAMKGGSAPAGSRGASRSAGASAAAAGPPPGYGAKKQRQQHPIILVSSSPTALLSMWNIKRFLEDGVFESTQDAKKRANDIGIVKAEDLTVALRTGRDDKKMKYLVVEGPEALAKLGNRDEVWSRVVAVITTGQAWQFGQYKWSDPKQLFHHVKGVYFHWTNVAPVPAVKDWNVVNLQIDPVKRHNDKALLAQFWRMLDNFKPVGGSGQGGSGPAGR